MSRALRWIIRLVSLGLLVGAGVLSYRELERFEAARSFLPPGSQVAGIPVGGLDREAAAMRVQAVYDVPVMLYYGEAPIHLQPQDAGFELNLEGMLPPTPSGQKSPLFWPEFWDFLNGATSPPWSADLQASYSEEKLRAFLEGKIASRYDQPAASGRLDPLQQRFVSGAPGVALDVDAALPPIGAALLSLTNRQVDLPRKDLSPAPPAWDDLGRLLRYRLTASGFDGIAGVWVQDLQEGREVSFTLQAGIEIPTDVAFTASSMIKIPILIAVFRRLEGEPGPNTHAMLSAMISQSSNDAADWLMKNHLDEVRGPLEMTEDLRALGLGNTFLAGYFALGSPLLDRIHTPANLRTDVTTAPDLYSQTTPADAGWLLAGIYTCAQEGAGPLIATFSDDITQAECGQMLTYLQEDNLPYMLKAGLPEGVPIARKHGYAASQGVIQTIGDAGIISTPGGDFVLVVFLHDSDQLLWDTANAIMGRVAEEVYGYFNLEAGG